MDLVLASTFTPKLFKFIRCNQCKLNWISPSSLEGKSYLTLKGVEHSEDQENDCDWLPLIPVRKSRTLNSGAMLENLPTLVVSGSSSALCEKWYLVFASRWGNVFPNIPSYPTPGLRRGKKTSLSLVPSQGFEVTFRLKEEKVGQNWAYALLHKWLQQWMGDRRTMVFNCWAPNLLPPNLVGWLDRCPFFSFCHRLESCQKMKTENE